jgi:quercetin dioxygenase-like cupin family protein
MGSLHRIADALGTTQQALLSMPSSAAADGHRIGVVRRAEGVVVDAPGGRARAVVSGARGLHATEFDGMAREYVDDDYYAHPGEEMIYVIAGLVEVDFADDEAYSLAAGDTITYPGTLPHRARSLSDEPVRLLLVQQGSKSVVDGAETVTWM